MSNLKLNTDLKYYNIRATLKLMDELAKGKKSGEEKRWLSPENVKAHFRAKRNR